RAEHMSVVHFLNVRNGDCSLIQHNSSRCSVIDVCCARDPNTAEAKLEKALRGLARRSPQGNFNQKAEPENPVEYLGKLGIDSVFRFILTHPDMDHMDGLKVFFDTFSPVNFWDTDNTADKDFEGGGHFNEEDWEFYERLRGGRVEGTK